LQIYKRKDPNKKVYLTFKSRKGSTYPPGVIKIPCANRILKLEAMKFVECIHYLNETPAAVKLRKTITPSEFEEIRVYDVLDAEIPKHDYRALMINRKVPEGYDVSSFYYSKPFPV
jgi:hypothetical protein